MTLNQLELPYICDYGLSVASWAQQDWSGEYVIDDFHVVGWSDKWTTGNGVEIEADPRFIFKNKQLYPSRSSMDKTIDHIQVVRLAPSFVDVAWRYDYVLLGERLLKGGDYSLGFSFNVYDAPGYNGNAYGVKEHMLHVGLELLEGNFESQEIIAWNRGGINPSKMLEYIPEEYKADYLNKVNSFKSFVDKCRHLKEVGGDLPRYDEDAAYKYLQKKMRENLNAQF